MGHKVAYVFQGPSASRLTPRTVTACCGGAVDQYTWSSPQAYPAFKHRHIVPTSDGSSVLLRLEGASCTAALTQWAHVNLCHVVGIPHLLLCPLTLKCELKFTSK